MFPVHISVGGTPDDGVWEWKWSFTQNKWANLRFGLFRRSKNSRSAEMEVTGTPEPMAKQNLLLLA
jgi:hypothetical protein